MKLGHNVNNSWGCEGERIPKVQSNFWTRRLIRQIGSVEMKKEQNEITKDSLQVTADKIQMVKI